MLWLLIAKFALDQSAGLTTLGSYSAAVPFLFKARPAPYLHLVYHTVTALALAHKLLQLHLTQSHGTQFFTIP